MGAGKRINRRTFLSTLGASVAATALPTVFGKPAYATTDPNKFRVGFIAEPAHGLHFLAQKKGYFKDAGLDVELLQFKSAGEGTIALKAGHVDIGTFGSAAPLLFISQGTDFTIFGGMMIGGQAIIAKPERATELKTLQNYKGKKIALVKLSTGDVVFRLALKRAGLDPAKDITRVEFPSPGTVVEAVIKGEVDAGIVFSPHFSLAENESNPDPLRKGTLEFWKGMVEADYVANKDYPVDKHIDVKLYKAALDKLVASEPNDKIYAELVAFYKSQNT